MEADIPNETNGFTSGIKKNDLDICPVSPLASGEGLPYAPVDWPNPGDTWSWKVGRRVNKSGFYQDRYLFLPRRLQNSSHRRESFSSKLSLKRYVQKQDPNINIAAFFGSFSWRVPPKRVTPSSITLEVCPQPGKEVDQEVGKKSPFTLPRRKRRAAKLPVTTIYKRHTRQSTKWFTRFNADDTGIIDLCSLSKESETSDPTNQDLRSTTDFECDQVSSHQVPISPAGSFVACCNSPVSCGVPHTELTQGSEDKVIPEDFDNFVDSLDDMLAQPLPEAPLSPPATDNYQAFEDEIAEARIKLSSLLAMDFHLLVSSKDLKELVLLSSKLQKDPSLNADQLSKLKLIEEIPVTGKDYLETMQIIEEVNKFFADLTSSMDKATSLRNEYNASKEDIAMLQVDINSSLSTLEEIDDQIAKLQSRRAELSNALKIKNKEVAKLISTQRTVADSLPKVVHEVQLANSKKLEWEQKKKNALKREAEILAKIAPLRGFSL
ncbi:uncharacterized protein LOC100257987 isoform X3 [Vitis vinifera]|nr:uncharacterized protein LOC100257987 isoform X3 [Vitis vinifera]XP_010649912.1 uncharacterized protein LOC100257987 isoform X3 [Vitis vinifera]XP_010649913.1 uncharacterized protein LOC100257987 isoform X3 [Vitis vinifera]XP_010649915.1 uncharacterized protein LOC100257987 isoform X3 [Vitis vinifera]XP_019075648.1 uncharacterized protein LOC100257987 isoform X3 [Vitis vinifera]XP_019075649.1 uncharacterized protein LOC100257987 isoform X3 [Vitis vinifera]XP_019075650.1 uncharacterized prot|eukprot:XP_010649911.1 PREDICTED: uncharacterized protein LOC100257987 isoform X3 [Vitis vinifera]